MTIRGKWSIALLSVLVVSLALNLFIIGFAASRVYQFHHGRGPGIERMFSSFLAKFPREIRHELREEMEDIRPEMSAAMRDLHNARRDMIEVMRDPGMTSEALGHAMMRVREKLDAVQTLGLEAVRRVVDEADPRLRSEIEQRRPRWRRGERD